MAPCKQDMFKCYSGFVEGDTRFLMIKMGLVDMKDIHIIANTPQIDQEHRGLIY